MFGFNTNPRPPSIPIDPAKLELKPNETLTLTLPDNRTLGYATYGSTSPSDPVIFLFHGMPGSRICGRTWDTLCARIGARLIAIDRPGCGLSSLAHRSLTDWPQDIANLADHLHLPRFSIIGASGGGPFALACARFIPPARLRGTTVVCGIGTMESALAALPYLPRLGGLTMWITGLVARWLILPRILRPYCTRDAARLKRVLEDQCSNEADKALLSDPSRETNGDDAVVQFLEAFRQGARGCWLDGALLTKDWGFDVRNVPGEKVWLVHGDRDGVAPLSMARWIDERLGGGRLRVVEGVTHFTVWKECEEQIFRQSMEA
ncbi:Alpha/Beta hydrolase protein [Ampelomyces quisqualis]|uniref:Alpha/Beta hydrolase protein n=1 Tax=Ampelomyces quisqualis TaxID=50730 RepID=A0A6A5QDQ5_AMPQU|nr:Alpha/Beta hydrolase protein [Ampelomyces quisqualis]